MKLKNTKYLTIFIYLFISQLTFPVEPNIVQNGENKNKTGNILLQHDFTKAEEAKDKFIKFLEEQVKQGKLKEVPYIEEDLFVHLHSEKEALAKTGIIFDFKTEEDDNTLSILKNKNIDIENGSLEVTGNPWSYPTGKREAIIENSKILLKKDRSYAKYLSANSELLKKYYYPFISNGKRQQIEDIRTEKYITEDFKKPINVINALLHLKNSELSVLATSGDNDDILVKNILAPIPNVKNKEFLGPRTGLHITRDALKLGTGKYDLLTTGDIYILGEIHELFSFKSYDKESLLNWKKNRFKKGVGTPLFLLGEKAKIKAKQFIISADELYNLNIVATVPELIGITHNPKEDEMIVFRNNSEAEFEKFRASTVNIKFEGGKLILKNETESPFSTALSQIQGKGIFVIEGPSILREGHAQGGLIDKYSIYTLLEFLPHSQIDVSYIKDSYRSNWGHSVTSVKDEALKAGEYKFILDNNTKTYLGYSSRQNYETIKNDPNSDIAKGIDVIHASDADMHFKKGSGLHLYRKKFSHIPLKRNGAYSNENDEQGNLSEFTGHLTFDNSKIHLRSNLKDELSDQLISTNYPIIGEGATISLNNQGGSGFTGKEQIVLIKANKGTGSKTKFNISGGKITLGGYDYKLYERISENGKEYYLAHGIVEDVKPENVKPKKFNSEIIDTSNFTSVNSLLAGDIKNKKLKSEVKTNDYALNLNNALNIENSEIAGLGGKGIISKRAKLTLKKSGLFATQGLALDGVGKEELLSVDKDSSLVLENSTGGAALALKEASIKLDNSKKVNLKGSYSIYSNGGSITGSALFNIDGNIYHKGEGGINLTLEKGSVLNASILDVTGDVNSSKLHFKAGSEMYINNYSNMNMLFDKGSKLHLYLKEDADRKLDILYRGNRVVFTEPIHLDNTDIYFRTNMDKEESDRLEFLSTLTGTGANLHLNNHADIDMPLGGKEVDLVIAETPKDFKWNLANSVEIGGYFYNAKLKKKTNGLGKDIISITVGNANERKATLSSTSKAIISSSVSDYTAYNSIKDSIFDSLYLNVPTEKKNSVWAKISNDNFETKDYGMTNQLNTILVGVDRALDKEKTIYGGVFAGHYKNNKKIKESSGSGSLEGFAGGAYLSYRGYLGFGDFIAMYGKGESKYNVLDTASATVNNKQNSDYLGAGVRFGRQFFIGGEDNFYLESSAKITYGRIAPENSIASNKLSTKVDAIKSWTTGAYAKLGYKNQLSFGNINSYAKVGVTQEILGKYKVHLNKNGLEEIKLDGNVMNYGVGLEYTIGNNSFQVDFDIKNSPVLKNYYKVSVGYQYKF